MDPLDRDQHRQLALGRTHELIDFYEARANKDWRNYYTLQILTIGLAAITPCLIAVANANPKNGLLTWLELFFPAGAAIAAGVGHVFRWREDGLRYSRAREALRGLLWRFETRTAQFGPSLDENQALDRLVTLADQLNLQVITERSAEQRTVSVAASAPGPAGASPNA